MALPDPDGSAPQATEEQFKSDFNALYALFQANQEVAKCQVDYDDAKKALSDAKDYRDKLNTRINNYVVIRREENIQNGLFAEGMEAGPPLDQWRKDTGFTDRGHVDGMTGEYKPHENNDSEHDGS